MIPLGFESLNQIPEQRYHMQFYVHDVLKDKQLILQPSLSDCGYSQGFVKPYHAAKYVQWLIRKLECQIQKCILCASGPVAP